MRKPFTALLVLLAFICVQSLAQTGNVQPPRRAVALTFDDLPYANPVGDYLPNARRATSELMRVLKAHDAPAIGFVNEVSLHNANELEARTELLRQWVDAGMMLGNHTFSHADFNKLTVEQFQNEITRGDVITRRLMENKRPYQLYFRHPVTHTGDTKEKKEAIELFLAARGYKVTPHTIENSDFIFNVGYVQAKVRKDEALVKRLSEAYLELTVEATEIAERTSPRIFGREIPQVLLLHANDINADLLDQMLRLYTSRGYRFITLDEAMSDPAYQTRDNVVSLRGPTWLWRWSESLGLNIDFKDDPDPPEWVMAFYLARIAR